MEQNFFESVRIQKKRTNPVRLIVILVIIAGFGYLLFGAANNFVTYRNLSSELNVLRADTTDHNQIVGQLAEAQRELSLRNLQLSALATGDVFARENRVVTSDMLLWIEYLTPSPISIQSTSVASRALQLECMAERFYVVAQFQESFRTSDVFTSPLVHTATRQVPQQDVSPSTVDANNSYNDADNDSFVMEGAYQFNATAFVVRDIAIFTDILTILDDANVSESFMTEIFSHNWLSGLMMSDVFTFMSEMHLEEPTPDEVPPYEENGSDDDVDAVEGDEE